MTTKVVNLFSTFFFSFFKKTFGCTTQHAGSQFPDQGSNPHPLQWNRGLLTTGPPGKSLISLGISIPSLAFNSAYMSLINVFIGNEAI